MPLVWTTIKPPPPPPSRRLAISCQGPTNQEPGKQPKLEEFLLHSGSLGQRVETATFCKCSTPFLLTATCLLLHRLEDMPFYLNTLQSLRHFCLADTLLICPKYE